ncbi:MAG: hypothetical protein HXK47_05035 [Atopobium sp.]|nr:hypothetical protein [Atopobium sp.]
MLSSVYDGGQTANDILVGYTSYLRDEVANLKDDEIEEIIKKLELCADSRHGVDRRRAINSLIDICRTELDDRDLVRCLVDAGLIVGINSIEGVSDE